MKNPTRKYASGFRVRPLSASSLRAAARHPLPATGKRIRGVLSKHANTAPHSGPFHSRDPLDPPSVHPLHVSVLTATLHSRLRGFWGVPRPYQQWSFSEPSLCALPLTRTFFPRVPTWFAPVYKPSLLPDGVMSCLPHRRFQSLCLLLSSS